MNIGGRFDESLHRYFYSYMRVYDVIKLWEYPSYHSSINLNYFISYLTHTT